MIMTQIPITIESSGVADTTTRFHGLAVDEPLDPQFWETQQDAIIGNAANLFEYRQEVELGTGVHTIEYGNSAPPQCWKATISVGDTVVATSGNVGQGRHLIAQFIIGRKGQIRKVPFLSRAIFPKIKALARIKGIITRQRRQDLREGLRPR